MSAVWERLVQADKALVKAQLPNSTLFPGLTAAQVWDQIQQNVDPVQMPAVLITVEGLKSAYEAISEDQDAVTRPVLICVVDRNDPKYVGPRAKYLQWNESLIRIFRLGVQQGSILHQVQESVPEATACWLDPNPVIEPTGKLYQFFKTGFALRYRCLEPRGITGQ